MNRKNLKAGKLYWCRRCDNYCTTDQLEIWKYGPMSDEDLELDPNDIIDIVFMNDQSIFCFIEVVQHDQDDSLWWYKVITPGGSIGYFILGDEEFYALGLSFMRAKR